MGGRGASSSLRKLIKDTKINPSGYKEIAVVNFNKLKLDRKIYSDKIILTNERQLHIYKDHTEDYDRIIRALPRTITSPSEILQDGKDNDTVYYVRVLKDKSNSLVVVKVNTSNSVNYPHNSIITSWIINEKSYKRYMKSKNATIIYQNKQK